MASFSTFPMHRSCGLYWSTEPRIVATFADEAATPRHWSQRIPTDSTEACRDVEHYLNASFKAMRQRFPYVPSNWPNKARLLKLTNGALGLFVFARRAVRSMEDPNHADPISRLNLILSITDHLDVGVTDDHPFAVLDTLCTQILTPIPPTLRQTTKRIIGFILCMQSSPTDDRLSYPFESYNLMGACIIFGLKQSVVYSSLHKLHSVLEIPQPKGAHILPVSLLHASFGDYLTNPTRSKDFSIDCGEFADEIARCLHKLYLEKPWDNKWAAYTPQLLIMAGWFFYQKFKRDVEDSLYYVVMGGLRSTVRGRGPFRSRQDRAECLDLLSQINTAEPYWLGRFGEEYTIFMFNLWERFSQELENRGLCKQLLLRDLKVDHLDGEGNKPIRISSGS